MTARILNEANLRELPPGIAVPRYDRSATRIGIVHLGPGAFHRAHQASYVDALLHTDPRWAISAVSLRSPGLRDALAPQDGLYTLTELAEERSVRVIGAIREVLVGTQDSDAAFARLVARQTRIVTLTVTEKGYCLDAQGALDEAHPDIVHDRDNSASRRSVVGWLTEALRRRKAAGERPFVVISCDNLANNGAVLHAALVRFAASVDPALAAWIDAEVVCPRTMVDSITPATDDDLRRRVSEAGVTDAWPVQRERFVQWVIEDLPAVREADWSAVGVTLARDVGVYDRAKLRLLNGAHSTLAYFGLLRGHATVRDAMNDAALAQLVEQLMREDIAPTLGASAGLDLDTYIRAILERFRNPGVRHLLSQIAWDGSKKLPVRILATVGDALASGRPVERLAVPVAAWMRFVARQAHAGIPIVDPDAARLADIGRACNGRADHDLGRFEGVESVMPRGLLANPAWKRALETAYGSFPR
jgi:fructuronate reductase